jgi:hypothetical protein
MKVNALARPEWRPPVDHLETPEQWWVAANTGQLQPEEGDQSGLNRGTDTLGGTRQAETWESGSPDCSLAAPTNHVLLEPGASLTLNSIACVTGPLSSSFLHVDGRNGRRPASNNNLSPPLPPKSRRHWFPGLFP